MGDPTGCVVWCGSFQDMLDYIGSNVSEHFVKAGRPEWPHLDVGNPSRCKPGKAVMETAHESSVRRLANDWRCVLMDRLSWETQGWEVSCGRRCQERIRLRTQAYHHTHDLWEEPPEANGYCGFRKGRAELLWRNISFWSQDDLQMINLTFSGLDYHLLNQFHTKGLTLSEGTFIKSAETV